MRPALLAFALCAVAAALEGWAAGGDVKARFAELRMPPSSPSLPLWIGIGVGYYGICFVVLTRLLASPLVHDSRGRLALGLTCILMLVNAAWGYFFFRLGNLRVSFLVFTPYVVLALVLEASLARVDRTAAIAFLPYLSYLPYGAWWGYRVWRLNDAGDREPLAR